jgi:chemotaxis protein methyltransferase CheR
VPETARRNQGTRRMRVWSAGCSSGEEPYTLGMVLLEAAELRGWDVRILGTDLSTKVLGVAAEGVYDQTRFRDTPRHLISRYFTCVRQTGGLKKYKVGDALRKTVKFARLNLMESWPMRGPFDAIFCRNVMIYFDKPTQGRLVNRFWDILAPGGTLFIGHSESLTGIQHRFRYVQPTVYQRP